MCYAHALHMASVVLATVLRAVGKVSSWKASRYPGVVGRFRTGAGRGRRGGGRRWWGGPKGKQQQTRRFLCRSLNYERKYSSSFTSLASPLFLPCPTSEKSRNKTQRHTLKQQQNDDVDVQQKSVLHLSLTTHKASLFSYVIIIVACLQIMGSLHGKNPNSRLNIGRLHSPLCRQWPRWSWLHHK